MSKIRILETDVDFAKAIKDRRKERGIRQQELADVIDLNRTSIVELERGKTVPKLDTMRKVAEALGYRIALVPLEAVPYAESYHPFDPGNLEWSEIGDEGIEGTMFDGADK